MKHLVSIEIVLLDAPPFQGDLAKKCGSDAKHDAALDLCPHDIRIDNGAAVDRADDTSDAYLSIVRYFDFGNVCHVGREDELQRDPATDPGGQWLAPAGLLRGKGEDGFGAR